MNDGYDVIGDVHGHADKLVELLESMGYSAAGGHFRHRHRQAVFVGDLIDGGPQQLETVSIVRSMYDAGAAKVVMGNHEFNAIGWRHGWRSDTPNHRSQHQAFLDEVGADDAAHAAIIDWFMTLPLWLELDGLRVIHACWDETSMSVLRPLLTASASLSADALERASTKGTAEFDAVEILLKGAEVPLPETLAYLDKNKHPRHNARYKWWTTDPPTYQGRAHLPTGTRDLAGRPHPGFPPEALPIPLPVPEYTGSPVIFGHYWNSGDRCVTSPTTACVDFSAGRGGPLVAYRWSGESTLDDANFATAAGGETARSHGSTAM